jgi:ferredoxin
MKKTYQVQLINRNLVVEVAEDQYILEAVEAAGQKLPVGCRYGVCATCAARLLKGEVEQSQAVGLKPAQAAKGYVLLCIASPRSDCRFGVGVESQADLYVNPFKNKTD